MPTRKLIDVWRDKLEVLQLAEASEADHAQKFELTQQIAEAKEKIAALGQENLGASGRVAPQIAPSRLFHGSQKGPALLFGRDKELATLDAVWNDNSKVNVVTIVAWGGIGKSSLVAHWAARKLAEQDHGGISRYFDWTFFSQGARQEGDARGAGNVASADLFIKAALEFFGDPELAAGNAGAWQKGERLAQLVGEHRSLLILDGLEPLQDAKTGQLRDEPVRVLLSGLAANNKGLCLVTTRQHLPELELWHHTAAPEWRLAKLSKEAGGDLLQKLGVGGTLDEREKLAEDLKGHALTITLLGRYLAEAHDGDIRKRDLVSLSEADYEETSGHAFHVMEAYEEWLQENDRIAELSILRLLGLFDRPATPDCIAALRQPPVIPNLTDSLINLSDAQWNLAIKRLGGLGLIEEQPWEPRPLVGYSLEQASAAREATGRKEWYELPEPKPLENRHSHMANLNSLDAHPLIREFFAKRLRETRAVASKAAHSRLFDELRDSAPYWPEGLDGLQPLYQAVAHGCQAGRYKEACEEVYIGRILRGTDGNYMHYSKFNLGAIGADLAAVGCFFVSPWMQLAPELSETIKAWLLHEAAYSLRSAGRLIEAREAQARNLEMRIREGALQHLPSSAVNLSDLDLILGDVESAVRESRQSMDFADESKEVQQRMLAQANLANALHLAGQASESAKLFVEAEIVQRQLQPETPILYSLRGFSYCDLLLSGAETAAWRVFLKPGSEMGNLDLAESCRAVVTRATQTLSWVISVRWLLHIALDNLTLGRAMLYAALLDDSARNGLPSAGEHLDEAIHGLQRAARLPYVPPGLLTRAWLHVLQDEPQKARQLLDDAWQIAERGPMRLQLADVHLHRARLFLRADPYPWNTNPDGGRRGPGDDLRAARKLITDCGYGRRVTELQDAERALAER